MADVDNVGITTIVNTPLYPPTDPVPLTTKFSYADSCGDQWLQLAPDSTRSNVFFSLSEYGPYFIACQPSQTDTFSPGICPESHFLATITVAENSQTMGITSHSWEALCCEDGFSLDIHSLACQSVFYSSLEVYRRELVYFVTTLDSSFSITTNSWNYDTTRNTTIARFGTKIADYLRIFWQSSDLSLFEPSYAAALASRLKIDTAQLGASGTVSTTHTPGDTSSNPSPGSTPSMPLQTSAFALPTSLRPATKAGISVGAISGAAILIALMLFVYKWRRSRKQARVTCTDQEAVTAPDLAELQGDEEKGKRASELETREGICELPSPVPESDIASTWKDRRGLEDELVLRN